MKGAVALLSALLSASLFHTALADWTLAGRMAVPRVYHTATALPDGTVLVCGGYGGGRILDSAERFDPVTEQFRAAGRMTAAREYAAAAPLPGGQVLLTGGRSSDQMASTAEVYDPAGHAFLPLPAMVDWACSKVWLDLRRARKLLASVGVGARCRSN